MSVSISLHPLLFYYSAILYHAAQTYFTMFSTTCHDSFQIVFSFVPILKQKICCQKPVHQGIWQQTVSVKFFSFVTNPFTFSEVTSSLSE
ncbi:MAG: hypothetical protein E7247_16595 [Paenibacillaceae bacterium]|nr:hypothetical protein [Paenibacillaceae bacterium]